MDSLYQWAALFLLYSFLGWCVEVAFVAVTSGKVVNRGFLNGPVCPIYGVGMLGVLLLLQPVTDHLGLLFLGGMALCSLVELAGGWLLYKIFNTRWWDYSGKPFNLGGYICLGYSIMWGLAVVFALRLIHPPLLALVEATPRMLGLVLLILLYGLFAADLTVTIITIAGIKRRIRELDQLAEGLHAVGDAISDRVGGTALAADARLDELKDSDRVTEAREKLTEGREKVSAAVAAQQEKLTEGREKVSAAMAAQQEKLTENRERLEKRVSGTLEELQTKRAQLEERQRKLRAELRRRFSVQRLLRAFPDIRDALRDRWE